MNAPATAAVWLRVSTGHPEADNQVPDIEAFIARHGYQVTTRYEISEPAWNGGTDAGPVSYTHLTLPTILRV